VRPPTNLHIPKKRKLSAPKKKYVKPTYPTEALVAEVDLGSSNENTEFPIVNS
jgi:hypothetical protein